MLVNQYGEGPTSPERKYNPQRIQGVKEDQDHRQAGQSGCLTSYVERQNPTMRMFMRRFTRLTNGFSKRIENHAHAVALHFTYYNFGRIHKTLHVTPATAFV